MFHFCQRTEFSGCSALICHPGKVQALFFDYFKRIHKRQKEGGFIFPLNDFRRRFKNEPATPSA